VVITSKDNQKIKLIRKVMTDKKARRETRLFVLEGARLARDAVNSGRVEVEEIFVSESFSKTNCVAFAHNDISIVADNVFDTITDTVNSQGVIALCRIPANFFCGIRAKQTAAEKNIVLLDRVRDPGNVGATIRTAAAAGWDSVICIDCADPYSPKSVRASMGGLLFVDIIETGYEIVDELKMPIIAADMGGESVFDKSFDGKICLCIGSEADGLSKKIKDKAAATVSIPMQNTESLNAAVSAGILMYALGGKAQKP